MTKDIFSVMALSVVDGLPETAGELARSALAGGTPALEAVEKGFLPGIRKVGELWESGEYFLPELIASAEAMKAAMSVLRPALEKGGGAAPSAGKIVIGTVEGDIHDIGKNLVAAMLSAHGFEVVDLGADVKLASFIEAAEARKADIICLSALLTTTMIGQRRLVDLLVEHGLRDKFQVLIGGAPTTRAWAKEIGADGYAENANAAVREALELRRKAAS
jgi:corrinoid protein of di/trimethylamine methyltransferase